LDNGSFALSAFKYGSTFNGATKLRLGKMGFWNYKNSFNGAVKSGYLLYRFINDASEIKTQSTTKLEMKARQPRRSVDDADELIIRIQKQFISLPKPYYIKSHDSRLVVYCFDDFASGNLEANWIYWQ
jgi:hypothetical protein